MQRACLFFLVVSCACYGRRLHDSNGPVVRRFSKASVGMREEDAPSLSSLLLALNPASSGNTRIRLRSPTAMMSLNDEALGEESAKQPSKELSGTLGKTAALLAALSSVQSASAARSGGRVGGRVSGGGGRRGGGGGYAGGPVMSPGIGYGYGMSPFGFSPFGFGFSPFGFGFGVPAPLLLFAIFALAATSIRERDVGALDDAPGAALCLQLAVYCKDRGDSLYNKINKIASGADTSTEYGLQRLVSDVGLAMLRSSNDWVAGRTTSATKGILSNDVEEQYNRISVQERTKFEMERRALKRTTIGQPTHMVVTLVVLLRDGRSLPEISTLGDMRKAIQDLTAEVSMEDNLMGAEVIWTPEEDNDVMDKDDMFLNFPELVSL